MLLFHMTTAAHKQDQSGQENDCCYCSQRTVQCNSVALWLMDGTVPLTPALSPRRGRAFASRISDFELLSDFVIRISLLFGVND